MLLSDRLKFVHLKKKSPSHTEVSLGVLQKTMLDMLFLGNLFKKQFTHFCCCTDDTQLLSSKMLSKSFEQPMI